MIRIEHIVTRKAAYVNKKTLPRGKVNKLLSVYAILSYTLSVTEGLTSCHTTSHIVPILMRDALGMQLGQEPEPPFDEQPLHPEQEGLFI